MHIPAMTVLSLRFRLLVGALLWTVGLFSATSALVVRAVLKHPHAARTFHDIFEQFWTVAIISAGLHARRVLAGAAGALRRWTTCAAGSPISTPDVSAGSKVTSPPSSSRWCAT